MFDERDWATWADVPPGYTFRTVDHVTGEMHLFAPDGRNLSGGPGAGDLIPDGAVNAAVWAAIREHTYDARYADSKCFQYHDMTPVVHRAESLGEPNRWGDVWIIEVQYSSRGGRAVYGVDRNNVPSCYMD